MDDDAKEELEELLNRNPPDEVRQRLLLGLRLQEGFQPSELVSAMNEYATVEIPAPFTWERWKTLRPFIAIRAVIARWRGNTFNWTHERAWISKLVLLDQWHLAQLRNASYNRDYVAGGETAVAMKRFSNLLDKIAQAR